MTQLATRAAIEAALKADPAVRAALGHPARIFAGPLTDARYPCALWRQAQTRPNGASGAEGVVHDFTLDVLTRETGADQAEAAVAAITACLNSVRPVSSSVHIVLVMTTLTDVMRGPDGRTFRGYVRVRAVVEPISIAA